MIDNHVTVSLRDRTKDYETKAELPPHINLNGTLDTRDDLERLCRVLQSLKDFLPAREAAHV